MRLTNGKKRLRQSLLLFISAYLAFCAFVAEDGALLGGVSRSLQEGEPVLPEYDQAASSSDDGSGDASNDTDIAKIVAKQTDILVIIMGEKKTFPHWLETLGSIDGSLSLLFGSFDEKIPSDTCENDDGLNCQVAFVPGTTWTQARNQLAGEAIRKEVRRGKKYDYWLFLDDDVEGDCDGGGEEMEKVLGKGSCWQKIFNFIGGDDVPENASTIALPRREGQQGFAGFSSTDAMFAAFKRERVPYLLPYVTLKEGSSEWTSQASLFCVMRTCFKGSAIFVPYVAGLNPVHHNYVRGKEVQQIRDTIADNYHDEKAGFYPCTDYKAGHIEPYQHDTGTFGTGRALNKNIPPPELELCEPMKERFERWEIEEIASEPLEGYVPSE